MAKNGVRVRGITIEIAGDVSGLVQSFKTADGQVRRLQSNLGALSNYINRDTSWKGLKNKWEGLTLQQELMATEADRLKQKIELEKQALATLDDADATPKVIEQQQALRTQIILDEAELLKLQQSMDDFGTLAQQKVKAVGDALKATGDRMKDFGSSLTSTGRSLTTYVTAPIVGVGTAATKSAIDFETAMDKVQSVSLGATAKEMKDLEDLVLELSGSSKYSATEAADALYYMGLAGWDTAKMMQALPDVLALATAGDLDLGRASDIVTDYITAFGLTADDATRFVDVMAKTMVNSNTDVDQLGEAFKYVAPVAGSLGYSVEDVSFALGLMANNGIKAGQAGTSLRMFMQRLVKPTDEVQEAMDNLGISIANDDGSLKSFREVLDDIRSALGQTNIPAEELTAQITNLDEALEAGEITEEEYGQALESVMSAAYGVNGAEKAKNGAILAGVRGMSGLLAIVNTTAEDYDTLTKAIEGTSQSAESIAEIMLDNTAGAMTKVKHSAQNLGISLGKQLLPYVNDGITSLGKLIERFSKLDDETKDTVIRIGAIAAGVGPLLIAAGSVVSAIGTILSAAGSLVSFIAMNPLSVPIAALVAVIGGLVIASKQVDEQQKKERESVWGLSEEYKQLVENIDASKAAYDESMRARDEAARSIDSETSYLQNLVSELGTLVDENGRVKDGYKGRVEFITSELNSALGTEITLTGNIIDGYKELQTEIGNLIEKKRQEIILEQGHERYAEAIKNSAQAYNDYAAASAALEEQQKKTAAAEQAMNEAQAARDAYTGTNLLTIGNLRNALNGAKLDYEAAQKAEQELAQAVEDSRVVYAGTQNDIENYQKAIEAVTSGTEQEARDALNMLLYDFKRFDTATEKELRSQARRYRQLYSQAQKDVANGVAGVSQETVDGYARMVELAEAELEKLTGAVKSNGQEATKAASESGRNIAQAEANGLRSVNMSGPGSEHIKQYVGAINSGKSDSYSAARNAALSGQSGLSSVDNRPPGSEFVNEFVSGVTGGNENARTAGKGTKQAAIDGANSIDAEESGRNFSLGVAKGIRDYIYTIEQAANEAAAAGKRGFNKPIAIYSPSRVMAESGKYYDLGIALGIRKNADAVVAEATELSERTAAAMTYNTASPTFGIAGGEVSGVSRTTNLGGVVINAYQQPGQSVEEFAEYVTDIIYQNVRSQQAVYG